MDIPASGGVVSDAMSYWLTAGMWQRVAKCRCVLSDSTVVAPPPNTYIHDFFLNDIGGSAVVPLIDYRRNFRLSCFADK